MRQAIVLAGAAVAIVGVGLLIMSSGSLVSGRADVSAQVTSATGREPDPEATSNTQISTQRPAFRGGAARRQAARASAAETAAQDLATETDGLERVEPRGALSEIGQALPPKPKKPGEWKGTRLFGPVAMGAGTLEAKGYRIAIAGVEPIEADERCDFAGRAWPCGMRARAAFRAWLRGRSVTCVVPPQADRELIVAECRVGKQDAAAWLVENGWARAAAGGDYLGAGEAALKAKKGIFGAPPPTTAASASTTDSALPSPAGGNTAILSGPVTEPEPDVPPAIPAPDAAPPVLDGPMGVFPKPPADP